MKKALVYFSFVFLVLHTNAQTGKYFTTSSGKCKNIKVFIDSRVQDYCGDVFTIEWSGACKDGYAEGDGELTISSKMQDRSFTQKYNGGIKKGKKEGNGTLTLSLYGDFLMKPFYKYEGTFKNDDFDGYGEFTSDIPYPVPAEDIGKGVSMEAYGLEKPIWRTNMFFYEYKGMFKAGRIADTEMGRGKTKKLRGLGSIVTYKGSIFAGVPDGKGEAYQDDIVVYPVNSKKSSYTGDFYLGKMEGKGIKIDGLNIGSYYEYEGDFINNLYEGKGKMTFYKSRLRNYMHDGWDISSVIEGNFKKNLAEGFCTIYFQQSAAFKYTGPMKNGLMDGTGEIVFLDDSKFRGNFKNGLMEGEGTVVFANGDKFSGMFSNDKPVKGTLYYSNGSKYEGGMSVREEKDKINGKPVTMYIRQGAGTITDKEGNKKTVTCDNDNCTVQ